VEREQLHSVLVDENMTVAYKPFVCADVGRPEENGGFLLNMCGLWDYVADDDDDDDDDDISYGFCNFKCSSRGKNVD
jgi:hypothetical protein